MPKFEKIKCRIIGRRGTGKSSLINAIAGELIADVGVTGTTMEVGKPYEKREFLFYDLPGYPTEKFPRETYIEKMGIKDSDCVIIVTSDRFYEEELLLIREISKIQPPIAIYAVRTKIDYSIERNKKTGVDEETTLKKIYEELRDNIQDAPVKGIYLTSADYPTAYDLDKLLNDISSNLSEIKKECFTADVTKRDSFLTDDLKSLGVNDFNSRFFAVPLRVGYPVFAKINENTKFNFIPSLAFDFQIFNCGFNQNYLGYKLAYKISGWGYSLGISANIGMQHKINTIYLCYGVDVDMPFFTMLLSNVKISGFVKKETDGDSITSIADVFTITFSPYISIGFKLPNNKNDDKKQSENTEIK